MTKRSGLLVSVILFLVLAGVVFALLPMVDPITFDYWDIQGRSFSRITEMPMLRYYVAMWKGTLVHGLIGDSFRYLGMIATQPSGIFILIGLFYLATSVVWIYVSWLIGKRKGRPGLGVVLGLILGIIGLVAVSLLPDAASPETSPERR